MTPPLTCLDPATSLCLRHTARYTGCCKHAHVYTNGARLPVLLTQTQTNSRTCWTYLFCSLQKDLTSELKEAKAKAERRLQETAAAAAAVARNVQADVPPTQGEARRWLRSGRYSRKAVATPTPADSIRIEAEAAAEQVRYDKLKDELQTWCLGTSLVCFAATVIFYSKVCPDVLLSGGRMQATDSSDLTRLCSSC